MSDLSPRPGDPVWTAPLCRALIDQNEVTGASATPLFLHLTASSDEDIPAFARACGFAGAAGTFCLMPDGTGGAALGKVLLGLGDGSDPFAAGDMARKLPAGDYVLQGDLAADPDRATAVALAWALGAYRFDRYKTSGKAASDASPDDKSGTEEAPALARLVWPAAARQAEVEALVDAYTLVRNLVNTPAADMGPQDLEQAARSLCAAEGAEITSIVGEDLLAQGYPAIYAVGASSPRPPRLLDLRWGDPAAPRVTLVGKGVVFDTGGLDIKPPSAMKLMKKDMGGAAHALGVALLIMRHRLPVRLRVLIPVAENAVSGTAMRPGDILNSRKGLTIEVNNTDAEGRLILADALAEGDSENPALLIDFATLTGAARVALGPDLPALFSSDDAWAEAVTRAGLDQADPLWRLPLWPGYRSMVDGRVGDVDNAPEGGMAGAITAALFLQRFVSEDTVWSHIDTYAWSPKGRPGHPLGGNALGMRAVFAALQGRFG